MKTGKKRRYLKMMLPRDAFALIQSDPEKHEKSLYAAMAHIAICDDAANLQGNKVRRVQSLMARMRLANFSVTNRDVPSVVIRTTSSKPVAKSWPVPCVATRKILSSPAASLISR